VSAEAAISGEALGTVRDMLSASAGLDAKALPDSLVSSLVNRRLRSRCLSCSEWLPLLARSEEERQLLLEEALTHETWFFRDVIVFDHLLTLARAWRGRATGEPVRILCAPCSTGEEAWSIAATLAHAGLPGKAAEVTAIDISEQVLQRARAGIYARRSLRNHHARMLEPFVSALPGERIAIGADLAGMVRFQRGNLLRLPAQGRFDAVFCRNALMYMHDAARRRVVESLRRLLAPGAPLFVGHAELAMIMNMGFATAGPSRAFCVRDEGRVAMERPVTRPPTVQARSIPRDIPAPCIGRPRDIPLPDPDPGLLLDEARALADRGDLEKALVPLRRCLDLRPMDAAAHGLAGIILDSLGERSEAIRHLRRALYLDPADQASRIHLETLLERRG
jgi:chemotaxis protein methyltransferase WspC